MAQAAQISPTQQGIAVSGLHYFDVMVLGITRQGKSTTSDKLLLASPNGEKFDTNDFSVWCIDEQEFEEIRQSVRFKNLAFFSQLENPHEQVNQFRSASMHVATSTRDCEAFSNDKTKVRVLDVPGFYGKDSSTAAALQDAQSAIFSRSLSIIRRILQVQTAKNMCFQRILYFLPVRGPLESTNAILQAELRLLVHYFGLSFLKTLVLVVTVRKRYSEDPTKDDDDIFNEEECQQTLEVFSEALKLALPNNIPAIKDVKPPVILLRLLDTCETVLTKVKKAQVAKSPLKLQLNPNTCGKCGVKIGEVQDEKVVCYSEQGPIPYYESKCHPVFDIVYPVKERVKQVMSLGLYTPTYKEVCAFCDQEAGLPPCMKIGEEFSRKNTPPIKVDHKNKVGQPERMDQVANDVIEPGLYDEAGRSLQVGVGFLGDCPAPPEQTPF